MRRWVGRGCLIKLLTIEPAADLLVLCWLVSVSGLLAQLQGGVRTRSCTLKLQELRMNWVTGVSCGLFLVNRWPNCRVWGITSTNLPCWSIAGLGFTVPAFMKSLRRDLVSYDFVRKEFPHSARAFIPTASRLLMKTGSRTAVHWTYLLHSICNLDCHLHFLYRIFSLARLESKLFRMRITSHDQGWLLVSINIVSEDLQDLLNRRHFSHTKAPVLGGRKQSYFLTDLASTI